MISTFSRRSAMALCLVTLITVSGCLGRSQPARFYLLAPITSIPSEETGNTAGKGLRIGVGPIVIPEYVDRSQIITRISPHELGLAEFHQWSEPLSESVPRILEENLSALLSTQYVYKYPWIGSTTLDYQVEMYITQFDAELEGNAVLTVRWALTSGENEQVILVKHSTITRPTGGAGYEDLVAAESRVLEQLSREIAATIKSIAQKK